MAARKMHADEVDVDPALVHRLVSTQLPQWADLPLARVESDGTDNAIYRLGGDMAVRLPRIAEATAQVDKESRWLPLLAPHLPLAIPVPLAVGEPGDGYPWRWSVCRWLAGDNATGGRIDDAREAASALGRFVSAMQRIDLAGGPPPGDHNFGRGAALATRDGDVRAALEKLDGTVDVAAATAAWEAALSAPEWGGPPVWIHGDLHAGNLLADGGRLSGVIDFGGLGVGDPACDVMAAWTFVEPDARPAFRSELTIDDATWARGRGWALSVGLIALPYYGETNPPLASNARRWIEAARSDPA